jgi:hypothetical protein
MPDLVITSVRIVEWIDKHDAPSNEVFAVGEAMRFSSTGAVTPSNGTTTTEANFQGIATIESDRIGKTINVVRDGILDVGEALAGLAPGDAIYLSDTDGTLATTAGTVSVVVGRVEPGNANGTTADLLLRVRKGA